MKLTLGLLLLTTLASCGVAESLNKDCSGDLRMTCNTVFGHRDADQDDAIAKNTTKNNEQDARLDALDLQNQSLIASIDAMSEQIEYLSNDVDANELDLLSLRVSISALQNQVTTNLIQLNALSGSLSGAIVSMINPCNDESGYYDEIILKTANGKYIAYFEDGGRRFLSEIGDGYFSTTDHQQCRFIISNGVLTF